MIRELFTGDQWDTAREAFSLLHEIGAFEKIERQIIEESINGIPDNAEQTPAWAQTLQAKRQLLSQLRSEAELASSLTSDDDSGDS